MRESTTAFSAARRSTMSVEKVCCAGRGTTVCSARFEGELESSGWLSSQLLSEGGWGFAWTGQELLTQFTA
jgi:hypothetical protein